MNLTKTTQSPLIATILASATVPLSAQITWDDGGANNLWSTPENWSDDTIPTAGNDYVVDAATLRPPDASNNSFDGDSLTIQNGAILNLFRTNGGGYFTVTHTIPALAVTDAEIRPQSSLGSIGHTLDAPVSFTGANTLNMNENSAFTMRMFFTGAISGAGSLNVTRDATGTTRSFEFSGDATAYSGDVSFAGTGTGDRMEFNVANAGGWGSGTLTVGNHSRLNLNTSFTQGAAGLIHGGPDAITEVPVDGISIDSLTLNDGEIALDLTNPGPDPVLDSITLAGDLTFNGGKITIDLIDLPLTDTPYTVVAYGGTLSANPTIEVIDTVNSAYTANIDYGTGSNSAITVTFTEFTGLPDDLVWTGATDDVWDVETTENWSNGGSPSTYTEFDNVLFDDTVGDNFPDVVLNTTVTPSDVDIDASTSEYLISGTGGIAGNCILTKTGTALAIIETNNTYDGGTDLFGGTLQVGNGGTSGSLGTNSVINDAALAFNRSDTFTFANVVTGTGSLEQGGSGTVILTGSSTYTGATTVSGGTLQLGDGNSNTQDFIADSSGITVMSGTLLDLPRLHASTTQNVALTLPDVTLDDGATLRFRAQTGSNVWNVDAGTDFIINGSVLIHPTGGAYNQSVNLAGTVSGSGTIEYRTTNTAFGSYDKPLDLSAADSTYSGDWLVNHVDTGDDFGALRASAANALGTGTVTLSTRAKLINSAAAGLDSLAGVVLDDEDAVLVNNADTTVATLSGSAGTIESVAGILTLSSIGIPDAADVRLTTGATLNLDFAGTDDVRELYIDGAVQALGTWGATGSGADNESALITGTGLLNVVGSDPFIAWIDSFFPGETDPAIVGKDADPDGDGDTNEAEFATNGNPDSGVASGKVVGVVQDVGGEDALTLTLPVRTGAAFSGATEQVAEIDGLTYRIQGSDELSDWTSMVISEVTPALATGLPALDAGWEYRTFRTPDAISADPEDFIRANFTPVTP